MAWTQISSDFIQYQQDASGTSASGYYLKCYAAGTTTPISIALDDSGTPLVDKVQLDSEGFAENGSGGSTALFIDQKYRLVLYINSTDADANTFGNAAQDVDDIPQPTTGESAKDDIRASGEYVKTFETLIEAASDVSLVDGDALNIMERSAGNGGGAMWDAVLASTVTPNTYNIVQSTGVPTLALALRAEHTAYVKQWGAISGGVTDSTASIQAAIDSGLEVDLEEGLYLIDPATSLIISDGLTMKGRGQQLTGLLADYDVAGSVVRRATPATLNDRIQNVELSDFSVFLNHVHQASIPANIQQGLNFRDVTRSTIRNVYSGNFRFGLAETLYPNAVSKNQAMRGYPFVLGNRSGGDAVYSGGEVNRILYCRSWWARKGITLDDQDLTGGVSATYNAIIEGNDIQTVEVGINQGSQFNTGCTFTDNLIQDIQQADGSTNDTFVYSIAGFDMIIDGGYVETPEANLTALIHFASTANNISVRPFYHDVPDVKFVQDDSSVGSQNFIRRIDENDAWQETYGGTDYRQAQTKAKVSFDNTGAILDNMNVTSVARNAVGDFTINLPENIGITTETMPIVTIKSNVSGNVTAHTVRSFNIAAGNASCRIRTWNVNVGADEDFPQVWVSFLG